MIQFSRARNVLALPDAIRERHQLADAPVRWAQLRVMLATERIRVRAVPMKARAYVTGTDGNYVIAIREDIDQRQAVKLVLHEFAHVKLGHLGEPGEVDRALFPCKKEDPREDEANLLAALLWHGAAATPDHPAIARLVAKLDGGEYRRRAPAQYPLELPEPLPVFGGNSGRVLGRRDAEYEEAYEQAIEEARRRRRNAIRKAGRAANRFRVKLSTKGACSATFIDLDGSRWFTYDVRSVPAIASSGRGEKANRRVWRIERAQPTHRVFDNELGQRRAYPFGRGELRTITAARLDRQLKEARRLKIATPRRHRSARQEA